MDGRPASNHYDEYTRVPGMDTDVGDPELGQEEPETSPAMNDPMVPSMQSQAVPIDQQIRNWQAKTPIMTQVLVFVIIVVYVCGLFVDNWPGKTCINRYFVWDRAEVYRIFSSAFVHLSLMHIGFNMMSFVAVGPPTERIMGSIPYILTIFAMIFTSGLLYVGVQIVAKQHTCAAGFSGILFAIMTIHAEISPDKSAVMCGVKIKKRFLPWASLVFTSLIMPGVSFLGHMCGILTGYVYCFGLIKLHPGPERWQRLESLAILSPLTSHPLFIPARDPTEAFDQQPLPVYADDAAPNHEMGDYADTPAPPQNRQPIPTMPMPGNVSHPAPYSGVAVNPAMAVNEAQLGRMVEMGFDREAARQALIVSQGNPDAAVHLLMNA